MIGLKSSTEDKHLAPLTDAEWLAYSASRKHHFHLIEDGKSVAEGPHTRIAGAFSAAVAEGRTVSVMSHSDWLKVRVVESFLES
jgi:hypothetical protein